MADIFLAQITANNCKDKAKPCKTPTRGNLFLTDAGSSTLRIANGKKEEIYKIKANCFFHKSKEKRCDWVLYAKAKNKIFFIELKLKTGMRRSVPQFVSSVKMLGNDEAMACCVLVSRFRKNIPGIAAEMKKKNLRFKYIQAPKQPAEPIAAVKLENLLTARQFAA